MSKRWVIPDVHGYSMTLKALIEDQIKPSAQDTLYFLGDYIDRGPDSKGVIDYIIGLKKHGYKIRALKGNHEDYLVRMFHTSREKKKLFGLNEKEKLKKEWFKYGGRETLKSFGVADASEIPLHYIKWMKELEYYFPLQDYLLVHAGFNFVMDDPFEDRESMLWIKEFRPDPLKTANRKVIHGHVPVSLDFIDMLRTSQSFHFIDLDNGVYMNGKPGFGNLVALELNTLELKVQSNLDPS